MDIDSRIAALATARVIDLVVAVVWSIPAYLMLYLLLSMLMEEPAPYLALAGLGLLILFGFVTLYQEAYDACQSYDMPLALWNGSSYAAHNVLSQEHGLGYFFQELVMFVAVHVFGFIKKTRLIRVLNQLDKQRVSELFDDLRSRGTTPRFFPAYDFYAYDQVLVPLISAEMIWVKYEGDTMMIGLNRKYDGRATADF